MAPQICGKGNGAVFVDRCVRELCRIKIIMDGYFFVFQLVIKEQSKRIKRQDSSI